MVQKESEGRTCGLDESEKDRAHGPQGLGTGQEHKILRVFQVDLFQILFYFCLFLSAEAGLKCFIQ